MVQEALVSIIIPTLNSAKYLNRCLTAIAMQTYRPLEIIIVDAGSKDNTFALIEQFKTKLNIQCFVIGPSTQSEARNYGIEHATGKYLSFCDSDDFYLPEKISRQVREMENNAIDVTYFDVLHFYSGQEDRFFLNVHPQNKDILAECIAHQTINLNSVMVRKSFLDAKKLGFPTGLMGKFGEDGNFIFQLALNQAQFKKLDGNLSLVEVRTDSHTQWEVQWQMKYYAIQYRKEAKARIPSQYQPLVDAAIRSLEFKLVIALIIAGKYQDAKNVLQTLTSPKLSWFISGLFIFIRTLPRPWIHKCITYLWEARRVKTRHVYPAMDQLIKAQIISIFQVG